MVTASSWGKGGLGSDYSIDTEFLLGMMKML
jgi:hypothetical protein